MNNFLFFPRALAASLFDVAFAVTSGLTLTRLWLRTDAMPQVDRRLLRGLMLGGVIMPIALVAQAWLLTATMLGSSVSSSVCDQLPFVLTQTHSGKALLSSGLVVIAFLLVISLRRARGDVLLPIGLLTILATTRAAAGHAAADGDFTLSEFVQLVHVASIAIWSGGVIAAGYVVIPTMISANQTEAVTQFMRKMSYTITVAYPSDRAKRHLQLLSGLRWAYRSTHRHTVGLPARPEDSPRLRSGVAGRTQPHHSSRQHPFERTNIPPEPDSKARGHGDAAHTGYLCVSCKQSTRKLTLAKVNLRS